MSEQMFEQARLDAGATDAAVVSDKSVESVAASSLDAEPRLIAPDHEAPMPDTLTTAAPKADASEPEAPSFEALNAESKIEAFKPEAPRPETPTAEPPKTEPPAPGEILIMSAAHRSRSEEPAGERPKPDAAPGGKRRVLAAAVIALAAMTGAIGGALATVGVLHFAAEEGSSSPARRLEASLARIDADLLSLKSSLEHTSKMATGQYNKASDRLDKLEKAQAEPAARLARLSDAVERLRAATAAVPAQSAAAKEVTGSVTPSQQVAAAGPAAVPVPVPAPPRTQPGRLPTVDGWVLRNVSHGSALVEGRGALYEVYAGDPLPGVGRVDAIRRQDGRWVVVTTKGLIVSR